jgi:hypothetical protein
MTPIDWSVDLTLDLEHVLFLPVAGGFGRLARLTVTHT